MPDFDNYLAAHFEQSLAELTELCAQPSISARKEGVRECAELVARVLARHGLAVQSFETPGSPVLVGRAAGRSPRTLLFYNHYDVQPPEPLELWTTPPFEPAIRDGALYARGAKDDKGELVARLAALDAVRAAHEGGLPCGVVFVVEGEEEIGSPHIAQFVQAHRDLLASQGAVWEEGGLDFDGTPLQALGSRGVLGVQLGVETLSRDAHSGAAHILPSAAWRLVRVLESLKGPDERIRIPGFYDRARPASAADQALFDQMADNEAVLRQNFGVGEFVLGRGGLDLHRAVFEPTCNIQGITTGYQAEGMKTVIPARASAKLDFRLVPDQDPDDIAARLRAHLDAQGFADVTITRYGAMWPFKMEAEDPLVQLTVRAAREVYGREVRLAPMTGGSSPKYAFSGPLGGIPVISPGVGRGDNHAHAPDEFVRLDDLANAARHLARVLDGFAGL